MAVKKDVAKSKETVAKKKTVKKDDSEEDGRRESAGEKYGVRAVQNYARRKRRTCS
ncbi:MAG: hypothetical protein M5R36_26755 [Deltaproteobacteria bacterium]|nr:hypothetical protein [Deltaproteobacteria bacterium]